MGFLKNIEFTACKPLCAGLYVFCVPPLEMKQSEIIWLVRCFIEQGKKVFEVAQADLVLRGRDNIFVVIVKLIHQLPVCLLRRHRHLNAARHHAVDDEFRRLSHLRNFFPVYQSVPLNTGMG